MPVRQHPAHRGRVTANVVKLRSRLVQSARFDNASRSSHPLFAFVPFAIFVPRSDQIPPRHRYLISTNSSIPYFDPSRPRPDCFMPPNGATSVDRLPVLI